MHDFPLLTTLALGFTAAWALGLMTQRFGLSPIVGYLLAGVVIGPYTPGIVADVTLAPQLAEIGVILLMFGVGLHFHLDDLLAVRSIAIPGAIAQSAVATAAGAIVFTLFDWDLTAGLVLGMAMAVASTVVLIRVLMDNNQLNTNAGHVTVGWLIVEDIFTVVILVLIPAMAGAGAAGAASHAVSEGGHWALSLVLALGKLAIMVVLLWYFGSRFMPWMLVKVARLRSRELFTLTILVFSIAVATGTSVVFGASVALGAFLAGMVVAQSPASQQAGIDALPMRDAFAVLFFVAVGMLFDPMFLVEHPFMVVAGLGIVLIAKPLAALVIVTALGHPVRTALTVAAALAQIGEFSFILGDLARHHKVLPEEGTHLLVACALVSITINPVVFRTVEPIEAWLRRRPRLWMFFNRRSEERARQVNALPVEHVKTVSDRLAIVVGYGPVGRQVDRLLREAGMDTVVIDLNMDTVTELISQGRTAIYGDATQPELLAQAGVAKASHLVLSTPHSANQHVLVAAVRKLNPMIRLLVRTRYLREGEAIRQLGADSTVVDEVESAVALTELVLAESGTDHERIRSEIDRLRQELAANPG